MYYFKAHNKDYAMGCYFAEDDWNIEVWADDIHLVKKLIVDSIMDRYDGGFHFIMDHWELYEVDILKYKNYQFRLEDTLVDVKNDFPSLYNEVVNSEYYLELKKNREDTEKEKEIIEKHEKEKKAKENKKLEYEKLKKEFEAENKGNCKETS
jgi:hypothetical protein